MREPVTLGVLLLAAACGGSDSPVDPGPTVPDSVYVAAGTYQLAETAMVREGPCLDLYDRPGDGETFMGWLDVELREDGSFNLDFRTDQYCYVNGSLAYETNHAGSKGGSWALVGGDSLDVTLSGAISGYLLPGAWFGESVTVSGEVEGVVRIRPDTLFMAVEPDDGAGGVVDLRLVRGG